MLLPNISIAPRHKYDLDSCKSPFSQPKEHNHTPNSQKYQIPSAQDCPHANYPPNAYPQDDSTNNAPSIDDQIDKLSLGWAQGPADLRHGSYMTRSPVNDDTETSSSTTKPTPGSSMSMGDQWPLVNSAPSTFSNYQHDQNAPMQGASNSAPSMPPDPKSIYITMHSPKIDSWQGLRAANDPGTDENWINSKIVARQRFPTQRGKAIRTMNFNGQVFKPVAKVTAAWMVQGRTISHETEFRVIDNSPFDVLFGRNLLSSPESNYFRDDGIDDTPILLVQSDISSQEQKEIDRNRAAADAQARELEQRRRPIRPSSGNHRNSDKVKKSSTTHKSKGY
ncbi:hypothetical protein DSL72_007443 [Monilinia vaccinii-corymbosi]|uniref:Uncharacterized protein n=1 Tax=Monilinia vaccinii-corymbosi TaxID=61207 RepID=A0A8A3PLM1_9HELO|nr:hypothetical protein DSL72_007443 [Monilinia vaccinii-corymbosi]